ncbi:hypothetical protein EZ313_19415 [Ramlibacter henchirensis]|uniref:Uncharacterized protein n=1 Tax=Ramlibacter henchirensis TaxID=204072 RepID=A0A4Z0BMV1_9BURK|nr:hypothetical protein [Ramlibacter henchirensis]TFZ00623.1 hypothetical protein EZ313_19415 [Ramlibacter henchirensis]
MKLFDKLRRTGTDRGIERDRCITLLRIGTACLSAERYDATKDPGRTYRKELAAQRERVEHLRAAANMLAKACDRGDRAMFWGLPGGNNPAQAELSGPADGGSRSYLELGHAWFNELAETLGDQIPELNGEGFWHLHTDGNLYFDSPLPLQGPPRKVATMLAFELTIYLRMFTAGRATDAVNTPLGMPKDGKPCGHVVASFCNATLNTEFDSQTVESLLKNSGLASSARLISWPEPE